MLPMRDGRTDGQTREDRATQPMDAGWLSFAIFIEITITYISFTMCKPEQCLVSSAGTHMPVQERERISWVGLTVVVLRFLRNRC